jgi:RecA-family ATPase
MTDGQVTHTQDRLRLRSAGYQPLPLTGKRPAFDQWSKKTDTNRGEIELWETMYPWSTNTGILTQRTPAIDIDILDEAAATAIEELAREMFEDRGYFLVRFGKPPKRAILCRTDEPFKKIATSLTTPDGKTDQKIEILGDGQQVVVFGIHPDTHKPYSWFGGAPGEIKWEDLPYIRAEDAKEFIERAGEILVRDFGFKGQVEIKEQRAARGDGEFHHANWAQLVSNIVSGVELHDSIRDLSASLVASGVQSDNVTRVLQAMMLSSSTVHDERWQSRFDEITRAVVSAVDKFDPKNPKAQQLLTYCNITLPLRIREWLTRDQIPMLNVTLFSGEGAIGKSIALLQLSVAVVLGRDWFGTLPQVGPVLYIAAEEDEDEIRRRLNAIAVHPAYGSSREALQQNLHVLCFAGTNALLSEPDRNGIIRPTRLFEQIKADAERIKPKLIVVDPVADVFGGDEINRAQTRMFITLMRGLAISAEAAVILSSHPSNLGIQSESGLSGSTAWHNSVRARMYFQKNPDGEASSRVLEVKKNNYGPVSARIVVEWDEGIYRLPKTATEYERQNTEKKIDDLFVTLIKRFDAQGRSVSHNKKAPNYAPAEFASLSEVKAQRINKKALIDSMERLFQDSRIEIVTEGSPSRQRSRLAVPTSPSNRQNGPSNSLPTSQNQGELTPMLEGNDSSKTPLPTSKFPT